jgi:hypothetical protein
MNNEELAAYSARYLEPLRARMDAMSAKDDSDREITRCLSGCVGSNLLFPLARALRDAGVNIVDKHA